MTATKNRERSKGNIIKAENSGAVGVDEGLAVGLVVGLLVGLVVGVGSGSCWAPRFIVTRCVL